TAPEGILDRLHATSHNTHPFGEQCSYALRQPAGLHDNVTVGERQDIAARFADSLITLDRRIPQPRRGLVLKDYKARIPNIRKHAPGAVARGADQNHLP